MFEIEQGCVWDRVLRDSIPNIGGFEIKNEVVVWTARLLEDQQPYLET